jgi:hypothetical protein
VCDLSGNPNPPLFQIPCIRWGLNFLTSELALKSVRHFLASNFFLSRKKRLDISHEISFGMLIMGQKQDKHDTRNFKLSYTLNKSIHS